MQAHCNRGPKHRRCSQPPTALQYMNSLSYPLGGCAGDKSVARRLLRAAAPVLGDAATARAVAAAASASDMRHMLQRHQGCSHLEALLEVRRRRRRCVCLLRRRTAGHVGGS